MGVRALHIVNKFFPKVKVVKDATKSLSVEVTKEDSQKGARGDHNSCAMAVACKRKVKADGVIMSVSTAYIVKDKVAVRYRVPESVSREIVAFDRNSYFEPGEYRLNKPCPASMLGARRGGEDTTPGAGKKRRGFHHYTGGIRATLKES